jgi:anti-sigma regulatory factor (Ser/Thr protein kinase)
MRPQRAEWSARAQPAVVRTLRHAVTAFAARAGLPAQTLDDVGTRVSEAVTNAVVHAFRDGRAAGTVTVRAESDDNELTILVIDDGLGFAPRTDSPGLGLGIPTIAALASTMTVRSALSGGTMLSMAFTRTDPGQAARTREQHRLN